MKKLFLMLLGLCALSTAISLGCKTPPGEREALNSLQALDSAYAQYVGSTGRPSSIEFTAERVRSGTWPQAIDGHEFAITGERASWNGFTAATLKKKLDSRASWMTQLHD